MSENWIADLSEECHKLQTEVARLTSERDRIEADRKLLISESDSWHEKVHELEADLAAALAALERIANDKNDGRYPDHHAFDWLQEQAKSALSRLGTGEALRVVREATRLIDHFTYGKHPLLDRLKAVFGGLTD